MEMSCVKDMMRSTDAICPSTAANMRTACLRKVVSSMAKLSARPSHPAGMNPLASTARLTMKNITRAPITSKRMESQEKHSCTTSTHALLASMADVADTTNCSWHAYARMLEAPVKVCEKSAKMGLREIFANRSTSVEVHRNKRWALRYTNSKGASSTRKVPFVAAEMAAKAPSTLVTVPASWLTDWLISTSTVCTSALKRFKIRPKGVTSKKLSGALSTEATKLLCSFVEAMRRWVAMQRLRRVSPSTPPSAARA